MSLKTDILKMLAENPDGAYTTVLDNLKKKHKYSDDQIGTVFAKLVKQGFVEKDKEFNFYITDRGLEEIDQVKQFKRFLQDWGNLIISILAVLVSILALLKQENIIVNIDKNIPQTPTSSCNISTKNLK